ncbi:MAG: hypothetical protein H0V54_00440 [Chthoniobacterales bacterium]|nr:hypothetical protein [Chthoniobacterales bacterium]
MLRTHCRAPNHTLSSEQLAQQVGYSTFSAANMQYGILARDVARALQITLPRTPTGDPHWWRTLAYGNDGVQQTDDGRYEWIMRPELVLALQEMRWA